MCFADNVNARRGSGSLLSVALAALLRCASGLLHALLLVEAGIVATDPKSFAGRGLPNGLPKLRRPVDRDAIPAAMLRDCHEGGHRLGVLTSRNDAIVRDLDRGSIAISGPEETDPLLAIGTVNDTNVVSPGQGRW
ncbi:hypothetical protein DC429_14745 [Arthrobacter sp. TPD3018]|nr:hypothetical protein DC425_15505 [Sphingomonas sp. TPD3009]PVE53687.1 hypothetical protein DC429_14745 [Arthrobacter sp. TPD3018]